ncbi:MAG TPA: metallophosphoesterase [Polyangia bacterium]|jgi:UDP-2,3-diacylglucosamine pyrophosphatase LpxH
MGLADTLPGTPDTSREETAVTLIISDLHLSSEEALDDFYADREFAEFLDYHAERYASIHLVINGDWIDFLQTDPRPPRTGAQATAQLDLEEMYPLNLTPDQAVYAIDRVAQRHGEFFDALSKFLRPGRPARRLTVLRGNHDVELAFPGVQERLRELLGGHSAEVLAFPPVGWFDPEQGVYVEHGSQYDHWNALARFDDPFLDRERTKLEVPWGSVQVKTFWNRVEPEFPHIDKIRPMFDAVLSVLVQRPTFLLLKFDYFVDLFLGAWRQNFAKLFSRRPKRDADRSVSPDSPEEHGRRYWRGDHMGRISLGALGVLAAYFVIRYIVLWDTGLRGVAGRSAARPLAEFLVLIGGSLALIAIGRGLRYLMWRKELPFVVRAVVYRVLVMVSAVAFFYALFRLFLLPIVIAGAVYVIWDAIRTVIGRPQAERDPLLRRPLAAELETAIRLLHLPDVHTVVFGHTHLPMSVDVGDGKRFLNCGTWMKLVDMRNVRSEPNELNTYVRIVAGKAELMSWRGTTPARKYRD